MKIVAGRDYYDGAGMGVDPGIVFVRSKGGVYLEGHKLLLAPEAQRPFGYNGLGKQTLSPFRIFVAGDWFTGLRLESREYAGKPGNTPTTYRYIYDNESVWHLLEDGGPQFKINNRWQPTNYADWLRECGWTLMGAEDNEFFREHKVVVAALYRDPEYYFQTTLRVNGDFLKDFGFPAVMDARTAHMKIAGYVGGVLPVTKPTVELKDESKIRKAGFDDKSFRKPPGQKKRRKNEVSE